MWQSWVAIAGIVPVALQTIRREPHRDGWLAASLLAALVGVSIWEFSLFDDAGIGWWPESLAGTLLTSAAVTLAIFAISCAVFREAWRLSSLVGLHTLIFVMLAALGQRELQQAAENRELYLSGWVVVHIATAVPTYALVTLAALAALAAFLQQATLKQKRQSWLTRGLPSLADCDVLQLRLLQIGEGVLALGLITGMALEYVKTGHLLALNHKTVLTMAAFLVMGALLIARHRSGLRGRRAARFVLLGYLLLTLGYPGVKFVTDVLIAAQSLAIAAVAG